MKTILYRINRMLIAQYLFILGSMLILKFRNDNDLDTYDPHAILFLYYLGIMFYNYNPKTINLLHH
uniref:Uncharacterized protein n=1 Tax=viral metagenome TaxID=1070528 RepID=A0A6C0B3Q1_9ZZZZ